MTWKSFHNRGEILRSVIATAGVRRDGYLPMDVSGVAETFGDELTLLAALSDALLETAGDDAEAGLVQGAGDGGELGDDVLAVAALLEHPDHARDLSLGAAQPGDRGLCGVVLELHGPSWV